jgi:hypothetical protein
LFWLICREQTIYSQTNPLASSPWNKSKETKDPEEDKAAWKKEPLELMRKLVAYRSKAQGKKDAKPDADEIKKCSDSDLLKHKLVKEYLAKVRNICFGGMHVSS